MKIKSVLLYFSVFITSLFLLKAQNLSEEQAVPAASGETSGYCGADELLKLNPKFQQRQNQIDEKIYDDFSQNGENKILNPPPYIIPVVVHIIHQNGSENISDAQVLQGITDLNEAFANINYYDQNTGEDMQIQFCLAKRTPEGTATTGINRVVSPLTNVTMETEDLDLKNLIRWNPLHYLNFWLVGEICSNSSGCGVAGYAYLPSAHGSNVDGIVEEARWFGSSNSNSAVQVHEVGHYLGLYHTFQGGCTNDDCLANGDRVCDTPPDNSTAAVPCSGSANSCSTDTNSGFATDQDDMFWDYMDYGNWSCYSAFTGGQRDRMHWFIENVRSSLLESEACNDPCFVNISAAFLPGTDQTINIGTNLNFTNTSTDASVYDWQIDGVSFATGMDANYTFNSLGTFEIALFATNADPNCHDETSILVTVVCPVTAEFMTSNLYPVPGEIVTFTNQSSNATTYDWQVNGMSESNAQDLTFVFPTQGIYTICLQSSDGLCEKQFCQTIFASEQAVDCEEETFVKIIGEPGVDEGGYTIIPSGDGNFYVGAYRGDRLLIIKMNPGGVFLWQREFLTPGDLDINVISYLIVDSEGMLLVSGNRGTGLQNDDVFLFKYNPESNNLLWVQYFNISNLERIYTIIDPQGTTPTDHYIITGGSSLNTFPGNQDDPYFFKVEKNTGLMTSFTPKGYTLGSSESFYFTIQNNNDLYTIGRYTNLTGTNKMRFSLTKLDLDGNEQWSKLYHIPSNQPARLYARDFLIENQAVYITGEGDDNGISSTDVNIFFFKTDLQGNLNWVRKFQLFGSGGEVIFNTREVVSINDGFIILGSNVQNSGEILMLKTDKDGFAQWAKTYSTGSGSLIWFPHSQIIATQSFLYFIAETEDANGKDILLVKTDLQGNTSQECLTVQELGIEDYYIQQPTTTDVSLSQYDANIQQFSGQLLIDSLQTVMEGCGCVPDTFPCETTFIKTLGTGNGEEKGYKIITEPNGGFLLGGSKEDSTLIILLDNNAEVIWQRTFKFVSLPEYIRDMIIDSDGNLVGIGYTVYNNNRDAYIFKYDYINDVLIWTRELISSSQTRMSVYSIIENGPGGNFFISGETWNNTGPGLGCDGLLLEVDRLTGDGLWFNSYDLGSCENFFKLLPVANSLFVFGRYNAAGAGLNKLRAAISQFDLTGNELWSKLYLTSTQQDALLSADDAVTDNGLVVCSHGDLTGTDYNNFSVQLFKTDYSGNILWAKNYEIAPNNEREYAYKILNLPDGYLLLGYYQINGEYSIYVLKTNKTGEVQWAKSYGGTQRDLGYDILYQNGLIYITGETTSYGLSGTIDVFLAKLNLDGSIPGNCSAQEDLNVVGVDIIDPYDGTHSLTSYAASLSLLQKAVQPVNAYLTEQLECYELCVVQDSCLLLPNAGLLMVESFCLGDSLQVVLEVCNSGNGILSQGTPIAFYEGNPTTTTADLVFTSVLPQDLVLDSCIVFEVNIPAPVNSPVFVLLNDDGSILTPFDLENDFPNTDISECDFLDNIKSFDLSYVPPVLDIGSDTTMCDNATLTFDAGSGFYEYRWFDGASEQTYTTWQAGTYWVEVTDSCGNIQSDTVTVTILPETQLQIIADTIICPGTITLTATGFDSYQWFPAAQVDCDNCSTVVVAVDTTTIIEVVGEKASGCFSIDTILLEVFPPILTTDTLQACEGDTVLIFGNPEILAGDYSATFTSFTGCDSIHTTTLLYSNDTIIIEENLSICQGEVIDIFGIPVSVAGNYLQIDSSNSCLVTETIHLEVRDTFSTFESIIICELDTISIFGNPVFEPGFYSQLYQSATGCDSTHIIELVVLDTTLTAETITICENQTADIFGAATDVAGEYEMTFTATNNCDSTHTILLEVLPTPETEETIILCAGDSVLIFGNFENSSGDYSQNFTAVNTCDSVHTVHLQVLEPIAVSFEVNPSCFGNNNGSIQATVQGGQPGYSYQWNTGASGNYIQNLNSGNYTLTITDAENCQLITDIEVTAASTAIITVQAEGVTCYGDKDGSIFAATTDTGLLYSLDGENYQSTPVFENLSAGNYQLSVQDLDGCVSVFEVSLTEPDELILSLPEDRTILLGDSTSILSVTNGGDSLNFVWSPTSWLSCVDCLQPVASPLLSTLYSLTITNSAGCSVTDNIFIFIDTEPNIYIPNAFSPNGDGFNDIFFINAGTGVAEIKLFHIYDRWGELVFEAENFQPNNPVYGWDGKLDGRPMNSAVLVYYAEVIYLDGRNEVVKGDFVLLR